jgi:DNA adenine methylase
MGKITMLQQLHEMINPPICEWCNTIFEPKQRGFLPKFCSVRCRMAAHRSRNIPSKNVTTSPIVSRNNTDKNVTTNGVKPILKYPGAKWKYAAWITQYIPRSMVYVEPYFGSGAVYFNLPWIPKLAVLNDLDNDIVNLFVVIREHGDKLAALIEATPWARAEYEASFIPAGDKIEAARRFLVRCWQAHGTRTNVQTGWRNVGVSASGSTISLWKKLPKRIYAIIERLRDAEIDCRPALQVIERYCSPNVTIYADPPYVLTTRAGEMYEHEMTDADHVALLDTLNAHPGPVILSGYACALYDDRLSKWHRIETRSISEKGGVRTEVIWMNREPPKQQGHQQHTLLGD